MYRRAHVVLLLLAFGAVACSRYLGPELVEIRIHNASDRLMEDVVVGFPDGPVAYGDVEPGAATPYRVVGRAYRYAAVGAVVAGDSVRLMPIDYVGESLLRDGQYTYRLDLFEGGSLTLELVTER